MKQHLGRQSGVQKVEVSLIDGKVNITPQEDGQMDTAQLMKAVYDSGVTVAEMDVIARGTVVRDSAANLIFQSAPNQSFMIAPNELSKQLEVLADSKTMVTVRGQLYKKPAGKKKKAPAAPLKLLVLEVQNSDQKNEQKNQQKSVPEKKQEQD